MSCRKSVIKTGVAYSVEHRPLIPAQVLTSGSWVGWGVYFFKKAKMKPKGANKTEAVVRMEQREPSGTAGENVNARGPCGTQHGGSSKT